MSKQSTNETGVQMPGVDGGKEERATRWVRLSKFEVTVQHTPNVRATVYANGRQQIPVQVEIIAHDENDDEVDLTYAQLLDIALISFESSTPPPLWLGFTTSRNELYDYNGQIQSVAEDDDLAPVSQENAKRGQTIIWYTSARQVGTSKLAAAITSPSGVRYITNNQTGVPGTFNSWVIVDARPPEVHAWNELTMSDHVNLITNDSWDVDLYYIRFVKPQYRIVAATRHGGNLDQPFYSWPKDGWARKSSGAFVVTSSARTVLFPSGNSSGITFTVNDRPGQACAARVSSRTTFSIAQSSKYGYVTYFDQYGNSAPAVIAPSSNGNTLSLAETGPHAVTPEEPEDGGGTPNA